MAYDLEEQEQIDALKAWWKENGRLVLLALAAFGLSLGGVQGWRYYQAQQAREAGAAYQAVELALVPGDLARAVAESRSLRGSHPKSAYAPRAALAVARLAVAKGDLEAARAELQWAAENAQEDTLQDTARLRLARVQLAQKRLDEAAATLAAPATPGFEALFADLRGDVLQAQGKADEARAAYDKALEQTAAESPFRALVEVKRDALPGAKP